MTLTLALAPLHPLDDLIAAAPTIRAVDHLEVVKGTAIATVLAARGEDKTVAAMLSTVADLSARVSGPGEWLAVLRGAAPDTLQKTLSRVLAGSAYFCDQSDARVVLRLSGPNVRRILAKGIGVDLHPQAFAIDTSTPLLCGRIAINLARVEDNDFEMIVLRSAARALLANLRLMGREFELSEGFSN